MQRRKNIIYLVSLCLLAILSVALTFRNQSGSSINYDRRLFTLEENTVITTVNISGANTDTNLEYLNNQWIINDNYAVDQGMRDVFFAVISQVEILRPASQILRDSLVTQFSTEGLTVEILNNGQEVLSYKILGDSSSQKSYFMDPVSEEIYQVHLPGYRSYVAGIYSVKENEWRDRFIWDVNWTSMKSLKVDFVDPNAEDLNFVFDSDFVEIEGVSPVDTAGMLAYLEMVASIQAVQFYDKGSELDLAAFDLDISLLLEEIGNRKSTVKIYQSDSLPYTLGVINDREFVQLNSDYIKDLYKSRQDFQFEASRNR